jgi:hypothetical protein
VRGAVSRIPPIAPRLRASNELHPSVAEGSRARPHHRGLGHRLVRADLLTIQAGCVAQGRQRNPAEAGSRLTRRLTRRWRLGRRAECPRHCCVQPSARLFSLSAGHGFGLNERRRHLPAAHQNFRQSLCAFCVRGNCDVVSHPQCSKISIVWRGHRPKILRCFWLRSRPKSRRATRPVRTGRPQPPVVR